KTRSTLCVVVRSTTSRPTAGRTWTSSNQRALATVFGDFCLACRERAPGDELGQPAPSQRSTTVSKEGRRARRGAESVPVERNASNSRRSASASALSARSTFRREPSGNRTQAIHRCERSFQRTEGRAATYAPLLLRDVANKRKATLK